MNKTFTTDITEIPKMVIFDTDNTLYDYDYPHKMAMDVTRSKAVQILGISENIFDKAYVEARDEIKERLGETASSHSRLLYFQRMIEIIGFKTQLLLTLDLEQTYWGTFLTNCSLLDNVVELLDELKRHKIPTVIITDLTSQIQFRKIIYFGLEDHFDYLITSEESGKDKPDSSGFLLSKKKVGITEGPIWMIGDSVKSDIHGAKQHLDAITFLRIQKSTNIEDSPSMPDVVFSDFEHILKIMESLY